MVILVLHIILQVVSGLTTQTNQNIEDYCKKSVVMFSIALNKWKET